MVTASFILTSIRY